MFPYLDSAKIPIPSELFQFAWKNQEKIFKKEKINWGIFNEDDLKISSDEDSAIIEDNWGANITIFKLKDYIFYDGITSGGHKYEILQDKNNENVIIFLNNEKSHRFIPLLLTLNEYAEDFGMKKAKIFFKEDKGIEYRKLPYDVLFEHFFEKDHKNPGKVYTKTQEKVYKIIHKLSYFCESYPWRAYQNFFTINVPSQGSLGGYLACRTSDKISFNERVGLFRNNEILMGINIRK